MCLFLRSRFFIDIKTRDMDRTTHTCCVQRQLSLILIHVRTGNTPLAAAPGPTTDRVGGGVGAAAREQNTFGCSLLQRRTKHIGRTGQTKVTKDDRKTKKQKEDPPVLTTLPLLYVPTSPIPSQPPPRPPVHSPLTSPYLLPPILPPLSPSLPRRSLQDQGPRHPATCPFG